MTLFDILCILLLNSISFSILLIIIIVLLYFFKKVALKKYSLSIISGTDALLRHDSIIYI